MSTKKDQEQKILTQVSPEMNAGIVSHTTSYPDAYTRTTINYQSLAQLRQILKPHVGIRYCRAKNGLEMVMIDPEFRAKVVSLGVDDKHPLLLWKFDQQLRAPERLDSNLK